MKETDTQSPQGLSQPAVSVENPISGLMDLSVEVSDQAPELRRKIWFSLIFITFWLGVNLILLFWTLGGRIFLFPIVLVLFVMGVAAMRLNLFTLRFFGIGRICIVQ